MRNTAFLISFLFAGILANAQDSSYGRYIVKALSSKTFWGRGYTNDGMQRASEFVANEYKKIGLLPMLGNEYFQAFSYPVNVFPGKMELSLNGRKLVPGKDFIVSPDSGPIDTKGNLEQADSPTFINKNKKFIVQLADKLTWSASTEEAPYASVIVRTNALSKYPENFEADIEENFLLDFQTKNVCGFIKGTSHPDSFILITAHYDHLGGMGSDVYFPGANDNASGVAMMLGIAKYFVRHPAKYSIGFVAFAGEEIGLLGSKYFVEHSPLPLKKIRFVFNMDLEGTGADGITVVNATEFPAEFSEMQHINDSLHLLSAVNPRGKAANSDHYFFSENGVPAFFFYTLGGSKAYHDIYDVESNLTFDAFENVQKLIIRMVAFLSH